MCAANGLSDPFIIGAVGARESVDELPIPSKAVNSGTKAWLRTPIQKGTVSPVFAIDWSFQVHGFDVANADDLCLHLRIFDWDRVGANDFLGELTLDLSRELFALPGVKDGTATPVPFLRPWVDLENNIHAKCVRRAVDRDLKSAILQQVSRTGSLLLHNLLGTIEFQLSFEPDA
jgi:hypothetical protein